MDKSKIAHALIAVESARNIVRDEVGLIMLSELETLDDKVTYLSGRAMLLRLDEILEKWGWIGKDG